MSSGSAFALDYARQRALELRQLLAPACSRIEIAGSIRRRKAEVHDIELVAAPLITEEPTGDLWGSTGKIDKLEERVVDLWDGGIIAPRAVEIHRTDGTLAYGQRMGEAFKALTYDGIPVDLFVVRPPATWGVIFALRTGPGDWNVRLVTDCQQFMRRVENGQVLHLGKPVDTPEERDFFAAIGQPWLEPHERAVGRVQIARPTVGAM